MTIKPDMDAPSAAAAPPKNGQEQGGSGHESWGWMRRQRIGLGILLTILLALLILQYSRHPARIDDPAVLIEGQSVVLPQRIDPNTATVQEFARIPHLGDTLAQKIVQYREVRRAIATEGIVFHQPADLDPIPGIGKKLIEQLSPFLQFPEEPPSTESEIRAPAKPDLLP